MDRDCNIENLSYRTTDGGTVIRLSDLQDWMTNKKIIKKGLQPHPYADVYHAYAEGAPVQHSFDNGITWIDTLETTTIRRIKPPEPVCEYQYVLYDKDKEIARSSFLTEYEYDISCLSFEWLMDVKSKRVRS